MKKLCLVKIGGRPASDEKTTNALFNDMAADDSRQYLLVHGGGADVSTLTRKLGMEPQFVEGIRLTTELEMPLVDAVLAGQVNKHLVRKASSCGLNATGLCGADGHTFTGEALSSQSHTGRVISTDTSLLSLLIQNNYFPVISSVSSDKSGKALNINADEAALALASALKADSLIFLSDIPGIQKDGIVIQNMTGSQIEQEIEDKVIQGGMIVKARSSLKGLENGIQAVIIGNFEKSGDLMALLEKKSGTSLRKKQEQI